MIDCFDVALYLLKRHSGMVVVGGFEQVRVAPNSYAVIDCFDVALYLLKRHSSMVVVGGFEQVRVDPNSYAV